MTAVAMVSQAPVFPWRPKQDKQYSGFVTCYFKLFSDNQVRALMMYEQRDRQTSRQRNKQTRQINIHIYVTRHRYADT